MNSRLHQHTCIIYDTCRDATKTAHGVLGRKWTGWTGVIRFHRASSDREMKAKHISASLVPVDGSYSSSSRDKSDCLKFIGPVKSFIVALQLPTYTCTT